MTTHLSKIFEESLKRDLVLCLGRIATHKNLFSKLLIYLVQNAFERRKSTSQSSMGEDEVDFGNTEASCFTLKIEVSACLICVVPTEPHLQDIATEVLTILHFQCDTFPLLGNRTSRLNFIIPVSTSVTIGGHD